MAYKQGASTFVFMGGGGGGAYNYTKKRISKQDS